MSNYKDKIQTSIENLADGSVFSILVFSVNNYVIMLALTT